MSGKSQVAIVGMAALFPGAPDLETYWSNIKRGISSIADVPEGRLDPAFFERNGKGRGRFYCHRGGFLDAHALFDAPSFGVMPVAARGAEPDQLLTLQLAASAIADAGYKERPFPRERAGVILGRGGYPGSGRARLDAHVRGAEQLIAALHGLLPDLTQEALDTVRREFQAAVGAPGADAVIGLVPNLAASRIAQRLDFHGPAYTVDAACASALIAVEHACHELESGRSDLVIAGGVHFCQDEAFWSVFTELGALSRTGEIRPFDRRADGLLIGEGAGLVVLKRLDDAKRDDDRIYAVIHGTGSSCDGRGASLMSPSADGQTIALERAWEAAGLDKKHLGLLEAHGTATQAGDLTELATLARVFGGVAPGETRAVIGSVKSMIGHTMPAAGAAGLIKAALAIFHGVLPPTLHCEEPRAELEATRFRPLAESAPWSSVPSERVAGVNAFGFGGINAHVVLAGDPSPSRPNARAVAGTRAAFYSGPSTAALLEAIDRGEESTGPGRARLAVLEPTPERLQRAKEIVRRGRPWREREGIFFSPEGLLSSGGTIAFLFPGLDASFEPRVEDIAARFSLPLPAHLEPGNLEETGQGIIGVNRLLAKVLRQLGVVPAHVAGHSIGEWSAMIATGVIPEEALDRFIASLEPGSLRVPGVVFAAAGCDVARAETALRGLPDVALSHDNCPHQVLICGKEESIDAALARLQADSVLCQKLPFQSGFHTPLFEPYIGVHRENFNSLPIHSPALPLWSATTVDRYPSSPEAIRELALDHLTKPVRFRELLLRLHTEGARVFVQVGTGRISNFVEDTLRGRPHVALSANAKDRTGMEKLRSLLCSLFIEGADVDPTTLFDKRGAQMRLSLGAPLVREWRPLATGTTVKLESPRAQASHPLAREFEESVDLAVAAQKAVMEEFAKHEASRPRSPRTLTFTRELSLRTMPELIDHTFFRQPPGWTVVSDRHPVVPMTTLIDLMLEHAELTVEGSVAVGIESVRAFRWLIVSTPVSARISCKFDGARKVFIRIDDYCEGTVLLADAYPPAPPSPLPALIGEKPPAIDAETLYRERWMFHGPQFQGITRMTAIGDNGIRGDILTSKARGALLDNAGQLFGYWVMARHEEDRMAMPVRIDRVQLFSRHPAPGDTVACDVRIRSVEDRSVTADLVLSSHGKTWAILEGWEDRRFETDSRLWPVMLFPERNLLSESLEQGIVVLHDKYRAAPTRDQLARRFLGESERALYEKQTPKAQRAWLNAKIAAKDAVRDLLLRTGRTDIFPVEIALREDGKDRLALSFGTELFHVAFAQTGDLTFARASHEPGGRLEVTKAGRAAPGTSLRYAEFTLNWGPKEDG